MSRHDREAEEIRLERQPYKVKSMTRDLKASEEWEDIAESVMREILMVKFTSNKFCKQFLLDTPEFFLDLHHGYSRQQTYPYCLHRQ